MKKSFWFILTALLVFSLWSCSDNDEKSEDILVIDPVVEPEEPELPAACFTDTIRYDKENATAYNIEYPSLDPYGNPATLSGTIVIGDEIESDKRHARGMVLYNHFTVFQRDQCPSKGDVGIIMKVAGSKMFAVAADYYGFGVTEDKNQAYCISRANAQASVDALLAARELLKEKGYTWDDFLFNLGYSEGGQTSMGVLRLCTEKYPDIKFTHTVAGGGPYDIGETYRQLVSSHETSMPSTVISTLLAYNEYFDLGVDNGLLLKEPTLSNAGPMLLSMEYKREEIEGKLASTKIEEWLQPILFDFNSDLSLKFMNVFEQDNLSKGWTPRKEERIDIVHNRLDACVPFANSTQMAEFFRQQGFTIVESANGDRNPYADGHIYWHAITMPAITKTLGAHEAGAIPFVVDLMQVICHYLNIKPWFTISAEDLKGI